MFFTFREGFINFSYFYTVYTDWLFCRRTEYYHSFSPVALCIDFSPPALKEFKKLTTSFCFYMSHKHEQISKCVKI